ncbi:MAG TPA: universal stress protein, partial [Polyangiaceae bacterium]|nr:universal stress protein [Polyangiaceae bacterium]
AVTVLQVASPYSEHYRLGVGSPLTRDHLLPEVEQLLLGELGRWAMDVTCRATPKLRVTAGWGRVDFHLAEWAQKQEADLLVVGTHQRNLHEPVWQSSVCRSAIHGASCNVLCVPERYRPPRTATAPRVIVVPTDLTPLADRAIAFGASLLDQGGTLHLVHVVSELTEAARVRLTAELTRRVPQDLEPRGIACELRILEGSSAWLGIWQHAARAHADLICMATHSRDSRKGFALGSQTAALLEHAQVPVLLVPQDRES